MFKCSLTLYTIGGGSVCPPSGPGCLQEAAVEPPGQAQGRRGGWGLQEYRDIETFSNRNNNNHLPI